MQRNGQAPPLEGDSPPGDVLAHAVHAHLLLPKGKACAKLLVNGVETQFTIKTVGDSVYVNATIKESGLKCCSENRICYTIPPWKRQLERRGRRWGRGLDF